MTHTTTGDPVVTDAATFLARHAAARVWRHLADHPETLDSTRTVLLEHLPGIEADPVDADWAAARGSLDLRALPAANAAYAAIAANTAYAVAYSANTVAYAAIAAVAANAYATRAATRAVGLGCAGSDRIGFALTLLADHGNTLVPATAWELTGMVTEAGHQRSVGMTSTQANEGVRSPTTTG